MENKEWEENLKDILGNYTPEEMHPDWNAFSDYQHEQDYLEDISNDADFDESLREPLSSFQSKEAASLGWERIESSLQADPQFDENIRHRIQQFQAEYQPHTWTKLVSRLSGIGYLRTKLIAFKVVEVSAVLLLLFTVLKMSQMGKLPFEVPSEEKQEFQKNILPSTPNSDRAELNASEEINEFADASALSNKNTSLKNQKLSDATSGSIGIRSNGAKNEKQLAYNEYSFSNKNNLTSGNQNIIRNISTQSNLSEEITYDQKNISSLAISKDAEINSLPRVIHPIVSTEINASQEAIESITSSSPAASRIYKWEDQIISHDVVAANLLATSFRPISWSKKQLPHPTFVKQKPRRFTEFGIVAQMDYNRLRMPEDKLYSAGRQIIFPQQGIPSTSMGGGFTIGIGHPRWAIETGIIYSSKNFRPGRQLIVGGAFDNGIVEFQAMRLQLVSAPLQLRYRLDQRGPFKVYGIAGFGLHLIAQSDIDVVIKYHFPSLSIGENPNNNPSLAQTIRETRRVSEHIRDGAPLSTKSFVSLNIGGGLEYAVLGDKTLFLQSSVQYQVPKIKFSNNNGKQLRSITLQAGIRT
ncbi:MAG: hypothetical protein M3R25_14150, partial [Bacteroidota bacterium]|nr:hypothetical protein [Bacteroidota bacterium]